MLEAREMRDGSGFIYLKVLQQLYFVPQLASKNNQMHVATMPLSLFPIIWHSWYWNIRSFKPFFLFRYDQTLFEDDNKNRMMETKELFEWVLKQPCFEVFLSWYALVFLHMCATHVECLRILSGPLPISFLWYNKCSFAFLLASCSFSYNACLFSFLECRKRPSCCF